MCRHTHTEPVPSYQDQERLKSPRRWFSAKRSQNIPFKLSLFIIYKRIILSISIHIQRPTIWHPALHQASQVSWLSKTFLNEHKPATHVCTSCAEKAEEKLSLCPRFYKLHKVSVQDPCFKYIHTHTVTTESLLRSRCVSGCHLGTNSRR